MQIHFCDLCNESVPESDLEQGRAFLRKGRVVCVSCDTAMSNDAESARAGAGLVAEGAPRTLAGGAVGVAVSAPVATAASPYLGAQPAISTAPAIPAAVPHPHVVHSSSGSSAGIAISLVAVVLVFVLGYWAGDQLQKFEGRVGVIERSMSDAEVDLSRAQELQERSADDLNASLEQRASALRAEVDGKLAASAAGVLAISVELKSSMAAITGKLEELERAFGQVGRHDNDLAALGKRLGSLSDEFAALSQRVEDLATQAQGSLDSGAGADAAPSSNKPAWFPLVEQLSSKRGSERWQAMTALVETRDPAVVPYLLPLLHDEDLFNRMATARMLGDLGSPAAVSALIEALRDENASVRDAAYLALRSITKRELPFDAHDADEAERQKRVKAWEEWWKKESAQ